MSAAKELPALLLAIVVTATAALAGSCEKRADAPPEPRIVKAHEGEVLERGKNNVVNIKVDPLSGSPHLASGTQTIGLGGGIPVHMHHRENELLFVHEGGGLVTVGDRQALLEKGDTIFVPRGTWHGLKTGDNGISLLWVVTPPGLESFFREISSPAGSGPKALTPEQINDIATKHGTSFKPN
jgi:mannose-6-phosphate isomerase-like protein (cupin superfamily)